MTARAPGAGALNPLGVAHWVDRLEQAGPLRAGEVAVGLLGCLLDDAVRGHQLGTEDREVAAAVLWWFERTDPAGIFEPAPDAATKGGA